MENHRFLTKTDLSNRWGKDVRTINKWISEKKLKTFRGTELFPLDYIQALELENLDLETCSAFALRARDRKIDQLEKELATVKSRLLQVTMIASEGVSQLISNQAI